MLRVLFQFRRVLFITLRQFCEMIIVARESLIRRFKDWRLEPCQAGGIQSVGGCILYEITDDDLQARGDTGVGILVALPGDSQRQAVWI